MRDKLTLEDQADAGVKALTFASSMGFMKGIEIEHPDTLILLKGQKMVRVKVPPLGSVDGPNPHALDAVVDSIKQAAQAKEDSKRGSSPAHDAIEALFHGQGVKAQGPGYDMTTQRVAGSKSTLGETRVKSLHAFIEAVVAKCAELAQEFDDFEIPAKLSVKWHDGKEAGAFLVEMPEDEYDRKFKRREGFENN